MADPRFFKNSGPKTLKELAAISGATLLNEKDAVKVFDDVGGLDTAGEKDISFLDNKKYKDSLQTSQAGACVMAEDCADLAPPHMAVLVSKAPYKAYALIAQAFYPEQLPKASIDETASIAETAVLGEGCIIEAGAVIKGNAEIGAKTWIGPHAVIEENVKIGNSCRIGANSVISHAIIGDHVRIYRGCCIGQDGFGFAIDPTGYVKVPQLGRVIIGNHIEIGANTTIDRGSASDTVIGDGTWIDNLVQIGHNVKIGKGCVIVSQVGVSGSTVIEDYAVLAGQAGIAGHLRIGKGAKVAAKSGIMKDVPAGAEVIGSPGIPVRQFMRQHATLKRLAEGRIKKD